MVPWGPRWVAILCTALFLAAPAAAQSAVGVGIAAGTRTFDGLSVGEIRPHSHGEVTFEVELDWISASRWGASLSGRFGGSWFDYNGPGVSGNIEDASWSVRLFVDRHLDVSASRSLRVGAGYEYGEARSWMHNFQFRDEGPHAYTSGGAVRFGVAQSVAKRLQLYGDIECSAFRAHAADTSPSNEYSWLGRAFKATLGVRVVLVRDSPNEGTGR